MMREHLYRGIPKSDSDRHLFADIWKDNCEGSFVYGSLIISNDRYYICVSALCQINCCINNGMTSMIEVIPETVGQYTGLTDKNGKKIFEGDIGRYKQTDGAKINGKRIICIGKVVYNGKTASFAIDSKDEIGAKNYDYFPIKDFEIIGNIHDNPELLKGGGEE